MLTESTAITLQWPDSSDTPDVQTTWGEFLQHNDFAPSEVHTLRATLEDSHHAELGGGSFPLVWIFEILNPPHREADVVAGCCDWAFKRLTAAVPATRAVAPWRKARRSVLRFPSSSSNCESLGLDMVQVPCLRRILARAEMGMKNVDH